MIFYFTFSIIFVWCKRKSYCKKSGSVNQFSKKHLKKNLQPETAILVGIKSKAEPARKFSNRRITNKLITHELV